MGFPVEGGPEASPRHPLLGLILGCAVLWVFLWPWLPGKDRVPFGIEGIGLQTAWQSYTYQRVLCGDVGPFAPAFLAGYPLWAEAEAIPVYPFKAAFAVLPPNQALSVTWIVHFLIWFSGMYLLTFTVTRSVPGALIAGWVGSFSGPMLGTAVGGHLSQFASFVWLPWMAWSWMMAIKANRAAYAGLGALCLLASLMAGHPQYSLMAVAAAILPAVLGTPGLPGVWRARSTVFLYLAVSTVFTAMIAGVWLLPLNELVSFSNRAGGFSRELLDLGSLHVHQLATALLPHPYGNTATTPYVGLITFVQTTCFLGTFPALLLLAGASFREPFSRSLWALAVLGILLASSFMAGPLGERLDLLGRFQLPIRWRLVSWFALSLLCGCAAARLLAGRVSRRRVILAGSILLVLLGSMGTWFLVFGGLESVLASSAEEIGMGLRKGLLADASLLDPTALGVLGTQLQGQIARAGVAVLAGTLLLVWLVRSRLRYAAGPLLLGLAVLLGLYGFARPLVQSVPWHRCGWPEPLVTYLRSQEGAFRVQPQIPFDREQNPFPKAYREAYRNFYRYDMSSLDWGALAGVETTTGGFSLLTMPYQALTRVGTLSLQMPEQDARRKLNVRYVLAPLEAPPDGVHETPRAFSHGIGVFEDPCALPRVSFFTDWEEEPGDGWDGLRRVRPVENGPVSYTNPRCAPDAPPSSTHLPYARDNGPAFHTSVRFDTPGLAVFSELYYPGFQAEVDGQRAPLLLAWNALMAVPVPPGEHRITLRYHPRIWFTGACVSAVGLLGLALLFGAGLQRDRRGRPSKK